MAGAYCKFCGQRCFVDRVMPADSSWMPGKTVHLATCAKGAKYDREQSGYDFTTAANPYANTQQQSRRVKPLWKTTIVVWTEHDPFALDINDLAREATNGDAYCSAQLCETIEDPEADPDWDGTEFFDEGSELYEERS